MNIKSLRRFCYPTADLEIINSRYKNTIIYEIIIYILVLKNDFADLIFIMQEIIGSSFATDWDFF